MDITAQHGTLGESRVDADVHARSQQGIFWPYKNRVVVALGITLLVLKVALGSLAAVGLATQEGLVDRIWVLDRFWGLEYEFATAELTEGEGSLFWIITANGYYDNPEEIKNIAKFPLYPAVARFLWDLSGRRVGSAFMLSFVHSLMVWAALAETYRFWENYKRGYGTRALIWYLVSPLFMLHLWLASYMEPGFVALMWLSLTLEYNRKWAASSTALLWLTMLQPSGVILACFLGVRRLYLWYRGEVPRAAVAWALLPGAAWGIWMILTSLWLGRFLAPYAFQSDWGRDVYMWPWDRWLAYNTTTIEIWGHKPGLTIMNISIAWIALSFIGGWYAWFKLTPEQRQRLGGAWVFPLFTILIVLLPFSTSEIGVRRYAFTSYLAVWPLLLGESWQEHWFFQDLEKLIWLISAFVCFVILWAFVTGYNYNWIIYF